MNRLLFLVLLCAILLAGCAAGENPYKETPREADEKPAGFWRGLWHGIIVPVTFVISWFKSSINIYEVYNTGFGYNFGFIIGAMIIFGGCSGTAARR